LPDLNAAIGRVQLARFPGELRPHRVALARHYRERLAGMSGVVPLESSEEAVPHIFVVRIAGGRRDAVRAHLHGAGIEAIVHYPRNHRLTAFAGGECPVADALQGELLTLPLHHGLSLQDVDHIVATLGDALGH
jgi:dTDP-4-amino-4,6-dideoxygalactose transaminase